MRSDFFSTIPVRTSRFMWAIGLDALDVELQRVLADRETALLGDLVLARFDFRVVEFLDASALHAYKMVVMAARVELEHGAAGFEWCRCSKPACSNCVSTR